MRTFTIVCLTAGIALGAVSAQKPGATPYKLGTFMQGDRAFLGLVVSDRTIMRSVEGRSVDADGDESADAALPESGAGLGKARRQRLVEVGETADIV